MHHVLNIEQFLSAITSLPFGALIFLIVKQFLPLRREHPFLKIIEIVLITLPSSIIIYPEEATGILAALLTLFIILLIFHKQSLFMKFSAVILIFPLITAVSYLMEDFSYMVWLHGFNKDMSSIGETLLHWLFIMFKIPIWYGIYRCIKVWIPSAIRDMPRRMWLLIDMISLASFVGIVTAIYSVTIHTGYLAYPACFAGLASTLGCCYLCSYMVRTLRTEMQLETYQYRQAYYQEVEASQQTVRGLRHDMKNHLNIISTLLRQKEYEKTDKYLDELNENFAPSAKAYCPNSTVNAVLNVKEQAAAEHNISCKFQVDLPEALHIDDVDLCSLLSNTLDNAVEACVKVIEPGNRFITLKTRCENGYFSYEIVNSKANEITENGGKYETDKADKTLHGIGLGNVRRIVEKYGGDMQIDYSEDKFTVVILIGSSS